MIKIISSMDQVPAGYMPMWQLKAALEATPKPQKKNRSQPQCLYADFTVRLRLMHDMIDAVRLNASGETRTFDVNRSKGQIFFDPKIKPLIAAAMHPAVIDAIINLRRLNLPVCSSADPRARDIRKQIDVAFRRTEPEAQVVEQATEIVPAAATPTGVSLAQQLVKGIDTVAGANSELLREVRESNALMRQLLAVWQPAPASA